MAGPAAENYSIPMQFHQRSLPNGLQIIGETNPSALSD